MPKFEMVGVVLSHLSGLEIKGSYIPSVKRWTSGSADRRHGTVRLRAVKAVVAPDRCGTAKPSLD